MIVLRSPKGWTGPKFVDGKKAEGSWRSHQVPIPDMKTPEHLALLEEWLRSYKPEELFDANGTLLPGTGGTGPPGRAAHGRESPRQRRPAAPGPAAAGLPTVRRRRRKAGRHMLRRRRAPWASFLRDVMVNTADTRNFRVLSPDENNSNRLGAVLEATGRAWDAGTEPDDDELLARDGRVMEILSEHTCQGWLEGYLLTGRHGFFSCYEAFIHIVDSMFNQHAKWLEACRHIPWRRPIAIPQLSADIARLASGP